MEQPQLSQEEMVRRNARTGLLVIAFAIFMVGVAFAAVPLYSLFCRVTGFAGTTQRAEALPSTILERSVTIKFNGTTGQNMPWVFNPEMREIDVRLGQRGITSFRARNPTPKPITGTAVYNVTPLKAGKYFHKIQCFCFDEQTLQPGEDIDMPVLFFVDPSMDNDPNMVDVTTITLSYTFYKTESKELETALDAFYNSKSGDI